MSLRHEELPLARNPSDGISSALCDAELSEDGVTGVTTLTETGTEVVDDPSLPYRPETPLVPYTTSTVPVQVPFARWLASSEIVIVVPSGPTRPLTGVSEIHGLSAVAMNEVVMPGSPGMKMVNVTGCVLPSGTFTLGDGVSGAGTGTTTMAIGVENGPSAPHAVTARTR